jgi:uncharacterized membrane protein YqhA
MRRIEGLFERLLWQSRLVVLLAVVASVAVSLAMFFLATVDAVYVVGHLWGYASPGLAEAARAELRATTVAHVVEIVDGYLLGAVLLIFGLGLYELFISKIDVAKDSETSSNVLLIESLDDLKVRLAKVILMILIVRFFEHVISVTFDTPLSLLYLAGGIALIGLALYLSHKAEEGGHPPVGGASGSAGAPHP